MTKTFLDPIAVPTPTELGHAVTKSYMAAPAGEELWVDPAGDDANPGTEAEPLATLYEASKRLPQRGVHVVHLTAGIHVMKDVADGDPQRADHTLFSALDGLTIEGEVGDVTTFTVDSVAYNVITAQGSPGWTPDEFKGMYVDFGAPFGTWQFRIFILSNTADTITVAGVLDNMPGGYLPAPINGQVMGIQQNLTTIRASAVDPTATPNMLWYDGEVTCQYLNFDYDTNYTYWLLRAWSPKSSLNAYNCRFWGDDSYGIYSKGTAYAWGCWFEDLYRGINGYDPGDNITLSGCVLYNCVSGAVCRGGQLTADTTFLKGTYTGFEVGDGSRVIDRSRYLWVDETGRYTTTRWMQFDLGVNYGKYSYALKGWPDGVHDTIGYVLTSLSGSCHCAMAYSDTDVTLVERLKFFSFKGNQCTLADYVAGTDTFSLAAEKWLDDRGCRIYELYT